MGLNHTAAMLSPEGLKTFVLPYQNSFPNILTGGSGYKMYCYTYQLQYVFRLEESVSRVMGQNSLTLSGNNDLNFIQKFGFINGTPLIKPNFCILLPHRRSTTVSLETTPFVDLNFRLARDQVVHL